jgi:phosphoglucosamine mutase
VVISASHNPYPDNGIKIFSGDGFKLPDEAEALIEAEMEQPMGCNHAAEAGQGLAGRRRRRTLHRILQVDLPDAARLEGPAAGGRLRAWRGVQRRPHVFHELGADVTSIGASPDGLNINDQTGATAPAALRQQVLDRQADLGIGLDGDADRVVMIDATGVSTTATSFSTPSRSTVRAREA